MWLSVPIENIPVATDLFRVVDESCMMIIHMWWWEDYLMISASFKLIFWVNYFLAHPDFCKIRLWCVSFWSQGSTYFLAEKIDFRGIYVLHQNLNGIEASLINDSVYLSLIISSLEKIPPHFLLLSLLFIDNSLSTLGIL